MSADEHKTTVHYAYPTLAFVFLHILLLSAIVPTTARSAPNSEGKYPSGTLSSDETIISSQNAKSFSELIVPEFVPYIRSGALEFAALAYLDVEPEPETTKEKSSTELLRRVQSVVSKIGVFEGDLDFIVLKDNKFSHEFKGSFVRVYPGALSPPERNIQLFRERLLINAPFSFAGYSALSYRFSGNEEDVYWLYSPAIKSARQLTGTNRTDGILGTGFSLDDLFVWSGKEELVGVVKEESARGVVAFARSDSFLPRSVGSCQEIVQDTPEEGERGVAPRWNFVARRFPTAAGWIPSSAVFVPRDLVRLEISSRDPYSRNGRQILYVDKQTLVPVYKFVFDRTGKLAKVVVGGYGTVSASESKGVGMVPLFTVVDDVAKGESYILEFSRVGLCTALPERISTGYFDPRKLREIKSAIATPSPLASLFEEKE